MNYYKPSTFFALIVIITLIVYFVHVKPKDFDDCVLKSMKGVKSDIAAQAIYQSCRDKFPAENVDTFDLSKEQLKKITGNVFGSNDYLSGSIHNGNSDITITQLTFRIVPNYKVELNQIKHKSADEIAKFKEGLQLYNQVVYIKPLTADNVAFHVNKFKNDSIGIVTGALGVKSVN